MTYTAPAAWLRPRLWIGLVAGGIAWVVWLGSLAMGGWTRDAEGQLLGADHLAFYSSATLIRDGREADIYSPRGLNERQREITGGTWPFHMAYRNPPFYALLFLPTANLPLYASVLVWMAVSFLALGLAIWTLAPERPWRVAAWSFAFYPFFAAISFGQNTPLSLAIFAAVYRLSNADRPLAAGLVAGLLWFKPQLLIGLFIWWALAPRLRLSFAGVAITGAILTAISWLALPDASRAFVETLPENLSYSGENGWNLHSPRDFWVQLLPGAPPGLIWALTGACGGAAIGAAVWVARRTGAPVAVMFPVAIFLSLWVSPHTVIYEWTLLIAAAVVLWERFPTRRDAWLVLFAPAWLALTVSTTFALVQIKQMELPVTVQVSIPVLGVVGWLVMRELARTGSLERPSSPVASR